MKLRMASAAVTPRCNCPVCDHPYNRASAVNEPGIYLTPNAGDTTICNECMTWLVFRDDLSVRRMTSDEINSLESEERETLIQLDRAINKVHELQAHNSKVRK